MSLSQEPYGPSRKGKKKKVAIDPAPEWEMDWEMDPVYTWRIEQMELAGIDHFTAFRVATADPAVDYREAIRMHEQGATSELIQEILL